MKLFAERFVSDDERSFFETIQMTMHHLPDIVLYDQSGRTTPISCHMLSRAFARIFDLEYKDGYYLHKMHPHSWLVLKSGNIIDCYPYAMLGGPILVVNQQHSPMLRLYNTDQEYYIPPLHDSKFLANVEILIRAIRETMESMRSAA